MSTLDNALKALINIAHQDIVWTNSSPNSQFPPQTIFIPFEDDDIVRMYFRNATTDGTIANTFGDAEKEIDVRVGSRFQVQFAGSENVDGYRVMSIFREGTVTNSGVQFSNAIFSRDGAVNLRSNDRCLPILITKHKK